MLPLSVGFLVAGPVSGFLSDKHGARAFATGGLIVTAVTFIGLIALPTDFNYWLFAALLLVNGIGMGLFAAPNTTGIMNAVPAKERGVASGMRATFMNAGNVLSIGIFFSLMIAGLASTLPHQLNTQLQANGVSPAISQQVASEPPVGSLFSAFLGYNPVERMVGDQQLQQVTSQQRETLTGKEFFPHLIAKPFKHGLGIVFVSAALMMLAAALASAFRGGKYVHKEHDEVEGNWAGDEPITPTDTGEHVAIRPNMA
jgi:sugar phosphate permease